MDIIKIIADTTITGSGGTPQDNACKYIGGCTDENQFLGKLQAILNWIFSIIGIVAVIMIILGGFTMMTSSGDPGKVKKGKDTILYGVIGLVVALLAVVIVNFVITNI